MSKCLSCYGELQSSEVALHHLCIRRVFSTVKAPILPYLSTEIEGKMLSIDKPSSELKFVEGIGQYSLIGAQMAMLRSVTMRMAEIARVSVTPHTLIESQDGELYHLTRSIGYGKRGAMIEIVDLADLVNSDSYECVAEALAKYSTTPKLDIINLFERVLFGYLVGDAHLDISSFKMMKTMCGCSLAPAESITPDALLSRDSEMAMSLGGKRGELSRDDFEKAMTLGGLEPKIIDNLFAKFEKSIDAWCDLIDLSSLPEELKDSYKFQLVIRFDTL